jgi:hypothetical protein
MFPANAKVIRRAPDEDAHRLRELAEADGHSRLNGSALIGGVGGRTTPDRPSPYTHGDPLCPASWPCLRLVPS